MTNTYRREYYLFSKETNEDEESKNQSTIKNLERLKEFTEKMFKVTDVRRIISIQVEDEVTN